MHVWQRGCVYFVLVSCRSDPENPIRRLPPPSPIPPGSLCQRSPFTVCQAVTLHRRHCRLKPSKGGVGGWVRCSCPSSAAVPQKQRVAVLLSPSTKAEKPECNPTRGCAPRADQSTLLGGTAAVRSSWGTNYFWKSQKTDSAPCSPGCPGSLTH